MSGLREFDGSNDSHRRYNPLKSQWVLCSPHRTKRPWQGQTEPPNLAQLPQYDEKCYLCPGNKRAGDESNPQYSSTFKFENDFAAVRQAEVSMPESLAPEKAVAANPAVASLYQAEQARGKCYVICFSPRHDLTIAQMTIEELQGVISAWQELYTEVSKELDWIKYIQIFENKGSMMGCSNPHPHGQAWSLDHIPSEALTIHESLRTYQEKNGSNLLLDYAQAELSSNSPRIVVNGEHFAALVPYWATWPYEALICPTNRQIPNITSLEEAEKRDLADVLRKLTCRYDNLFQCSFPYSMGIYQLPNLNDKKYTQSAQLHLAFNPPLLRSASVRKFLVGYELFAEAQRDLTAEQAAAKLQECSEEHYKGVR